MATGPSFKENEDRSLCLEIGSRKVKKQVTKVKDGEVELGSHVGDNRRYEDLSSHIPVTAEGVREVQEEINAVCCDGDDTHNQQDGEAQSDAHHSVPSLSSSSSKFTDNESLIRDFWLNPSGVFVPHLNALGDKVDDKHVPANAEVISTETECQLNTCSSKSEDSVITDDANGFTIDVEERDKMRAKGAVPKLPLNSNLNLKAKAFEYSKPTSSLTCYLDEISPTETETHTDLLDDSPLNDTADDCTLLSAPCNEAKEEEDEEQEKEDANVSVNGEFEKEYTTLPVDGRGEDVSDSNTMNNSVENELKAEDSGIKESESMKYIERDLEDFIGSSEATKNADNEANAAPISTKSVGVGEKKELDLDETSINRSADVKDLLTTAELQMESLQIRSQNRSRNQKKTKYVPSNKSNCRDEPGRDRKKLSESSRRTSKEYSSKDRQEVRKPPSNPDEERSACLRGPITSSRGGRRSRMSSSSSSDNVMKVETFTDSSKNAGKSSDVTKKVGKLNYGTRSNDTRKVEKPSVRSVEKPSYSRKKEKPSDGASRVEQYRIDDMRVGKPSYGTKKEKPSDCARKVEQSMNDGRRVEIPYGTKKVERPSDGAKKLGLKNSDRKKASVKNTDTSERNDVEVKNDTSRKSGVQTTKRTRVTTPQSKQQAPNRKEIEQKATGKSNSRENIASADAPKLKGLREKGTNRSEACTKKTHGTPMKVNVIIPNETTMEKAVVEDYLKSLLPVSLSFTLTNINPSNEENIIVTVEFSSAKQGRKAVVLLMKTSNKTGVKAHRMDKGPTLKRDEAMKYLNEQREEVLRKGFSLVEQHQKKIDELTVEVDKLKVKKHIPLHLYDKIRNERKAVESKLEELTLQKGEFTGYYERILDRIQALENHNSPKDEVKKLRLEFGQECRKLTSALPIYARRSHIIDVVSKSPVSVILGETGSGKSTQLVQYIHQGQNLGLGGLGTKMVVCTQPRKVAAQSLAKHVADEMGTTCGGVVGYKAGLVSNTSSKTKIIFTTDHTLLNECLKDPMLEKYSCVIIDEAHERSIYSDLLLGMIKTCLASRTDLRVIVTSATIDPEIFVRYFGGAPVLRVSGRMFPVDVFFNDPDIQQSEDYLQEAIDRVKCIHQVEPEGDVLVFLTSPLETQKACERLGQTNGVVCLPLHGQLQAQEQQLVFEPAPVGTRKVVFATNSAETSITIPGIKYVVDTGLVKEKVFDAKKNMSALVVKSISKSSAEQRKGRAGRITAGKCYRLYTEEEYTAMEPISIPEILRVHLGQALLKLMEIGVTDPLSFDFVQSPSKDALQSAMKILTDLKAVDELGITDVGKRLALMPVEPRMAKVIFNAIDNGCGLEGIAVAALSSISGGVFYRMGTEEDKKQADYFKTKFCQPEGDIQTFLQVYKKWNSVPEKQKSQWCFKNYVNGKSIRACRETIHEIRKILNKDLGINVQYMFTEEFKGINISTILLDCFRSNLGYFTGHSKSGYFVVNDPGERYLQIHPSSSLSYLASTPKWVVYLDVLKTTNAYMLNAVTVEDAEVQRKVDAGDLAIDQSRLEEATLSECVVAEVGSSLMSFLIGPRFQNLKGVEKELIAKYNQLVVLDIQRERSQVKTFTRPGLFVDIKQYLHNKTAPERFKLKKELTQIPVTHNSNTRAVIVAGGLCSDILMPDETRTLLLGNVPDEWTEGHVELELGQFGDITEVFQFKRKGNWHGGNKPWGKITFHEASSALRAVKIYIGDILLIPEGIKKSAQAKNEFKIRIQWCRRPTRGFAFVTTRDPEDAMLLAGHTKIIRGSIVRIRFAKDDPAKLFVNRLSNDTTENDVRNVLSEVVTIDSIIMPREKVGETQPEKLQALTGRMNMRIMEFAEKNEFSVTLLEPKPGSYDYIGYIIFSNPETGMVAINRLNGSQFEGQKLSACAELRTSLHVQRDIYAALREQLDKTILEVKRNHRSARINVKELKSGHFAINLEADEVDLMSDIRNTLQEMISGHRVECSSKEEEQALFSYAGRDLLTHLQSQLSLFIRIDSRLRTVTIYGDRDSVDEVKEEVRTFLMRFQNLKSREISLKGDGRPPGLMKHLLLEHGLEMEPLRRETGVHMLTLTLQKHLLKATGGVDALERLTEAIAVAAKKLQENAMVSLPDDIDCTVCFCPIDESVYRLEYCGHPYCSECIAGLIKSGITSKQFPILCAGEECREPLVWKDFNNWLGPEERLELMKSSTESFVAQNSKIYKFCDSPDCPVVYRIGYNEGSPYQCAGCGVTICTRCHVQYHFGLTCTMYQSKLKCRDYDLEAWVQQDPENRALCPGCKAHIEKNGGCMRVHCIQCNIYICWKCMKTFQSGDAAYSHLAKECGGIFAGE